MKSLKSYSCDICKKNYSSYQSLWIHNKKFHVQKVTEKVTESNDKINKTDTKVTERNGNNLKCKYCDKIFKWKQNKYEHEKKVCKVKKDNEVKVEATKIITNNNNNNINNQLINLIVDKTNIIEELQLKMHNNENIINTNLIETNKIPITLNLNNVIIVSRSKDNYINATQLCQAGNKKFNHWYSLDNTKQLINILESKAGIPALELIEINKGGNHLGSWIHPDLAIQLAQWISPIFSLQVSSWIRTLFTNGNVSIDIKILEDKNKEIRLKDHKIQLLQDAFVKKQQRTNYPDKNVIYMLTTEDNKKKRIYIIGKATNFKNRLSCYNKTSEHEVIYHKECNKDMLNTIESVILIKLNEYQEKANRDRFILPSEKDITFFINIIENCINFFN
jgi:hypothetical protein